MGKFMFRKNLIIHNTSRYPDKTVKAIVILAFESVRKEAKREGWLDKLERPTYLHIGNSKKAFKGKFCHGYWTEFVANGKIPKRIVLKWRVVQVIHCNVGKEDFFPRKCRYPKYKDMPEYMVYNWQEAMTHLVAHELGHHYYSGKREGEYNCEILAEDALDTFRKTMALDIIWEDHQSDLAKSSTQAL